MFAEVNAQDLGGDQGREPAGGLGHAADGIGRGLEEADLNLAERIGLGLDLHRIGTAAAFIAGLVVAGGLHDHRRLALQLLRRCGSAAWRPIKARREKGDPQPFSHPACWSRHRSVFPVRSVCLMTALT